MQNFCYFCLAWWAVILKLGSTSLDLRFSMELLELVFCFHQNLWKRVQCIFLVFLHQLSNLSCLDTRIKIAFLDSHCFKSGYIIDLCPLTNKCLIGIQKSKLDPKPMYSKEWLSKFQSWVNLLCWYIGSCASKL